MTKIYNDSFYVSVSSRAQIAARETLHILSKYCYPTRIADFGCGYGTWTNVASNIFPSAQVTGYDFLETIQIAEKINSINGTFIPFDFETNEMDYPEFDLSICLEVVEHISKECASRHIARMCKSSEVILFSGATPGQGGTGHINEQTQSYWVTEFEKNGFIPLDLIRPQIRANREIPSYYKNNILLFVKEEQLQEKSSQILNLELRNQFLLAAYKCDDLRSTLEKILQYGLKFLPPSFVSFLAKIKNLK